MLLQNKKGVLAPYNSLSATDLSLATFLIYPSLYSITTHGDGFVPDKALNYFFERKSSF